MVTISILNGNGQVKGKAIFMLYLYRGTTMKNIPRRLLVVKKRNGLKEG